MSGDLDRPSMRISESDMAKILAEANRQDLPEVIRLSKNDAIKQAWKEVQEALTENQTLKQQLPEPYFARAEIWSAVNNYDEAMRDYLKAIRLAREAGQDLASYSSYFDKCMTRLTTGTVFRKHQPLVLAITIPSLLKTTFLMGSVTFGVMIWRRPSVDSTTLFSLTPRTRFTGITGQSHLSVLAMIAALSTTLVSVPISRRNWAAMTSSEK